MTTIDNSILNKIKSLLRLADPSRGATQAEAESAMRKAQEMMTKFGLDQLDLGEDAQHKPDFNIVEERVQTGRKKYTEDPYIARILTECFGVKILWANYWEGSKQRHTYVLVGDDTDVQLAKAALPIVKDAMAHGLSRYLKTIGQTWTAPVAHGFFHGVKEGYCKASAQGRANAYRQASKNAVDRYAIVLVDKDKAIVNYMEAKMSVRKGRATRHARPNSAAFDAGVRHGSSLDLSGNKLK